MKYSTWHIVYLSFESEPGGKSYIGKHSTKELNDGYLGSYKDVDFRPDSRIILGYFKSSKAAVRAEIQWQRVFKVAANPEFANKSYQTSTGFVCLGHTEESRKKMRNADRKFNPDTLRTALGKSWFYDPETMDEVLYHYCPEGYTRGRPSMYERNPGRNPSEETRLKLSASQRAIPSEERYWFGKEGNAKGTHWWTDPKTGETKRSKTPPGPDWIKGRKKNDSKRLSKQRP